MATSITPPQAQAMFKRTYGDSFLKVAEVETMLQDSIPYDGERVGDQFEQAIRMTSEWGFTFRASGAAAGTMNPAIALKVEKATITGSIIDFRSRIDVETMARAVTTKQAFKNHVGLRMEGMRDSMKSLLEWTLLRGGTQVATVASVAAGAAGTQKIVTFNNDYPAGFLAGSENMPFDIYATDDTTKRNTSAADAKYTVDAYDLDNRKLTLTAPNASDWASVVAGDKLWLWGSITTQAPGLYKLISNQTATLNGISATTYPMWRGATKAMGSTQLSMAAILQTNARCAQRGARKVNHRVIVSDMNFAVLNSDLSASRRYDGSYSRTKGNNGFGSIEYYSPTGTLSIESHQYQPDSDVLLVDMETMKRKGPSDVTFQVPGATEEQFFLLVPDVQAFEYRGYSHQGLLCTKPARNAVITGLVAPS